MFLHRIWGTLRAPRKLHVHQKPFALAWAKGFFVALLVVCAWFGQATPARADSPLGGLFPQSRPNPLKADTSRAARNSAIQSIPFEKLAPEARRKAAAIISATTMFRRMPVHFTQCDPEFYLFLVRHPDVLVGIWETLDVSNLRMAKDPSGVFQITEGDATSATAEFLYQDQDTHVVYCEGIYHGPLLAKPIRGRTLMVLKTGYIRESDGQYSITSRLDTFTQIDNVTVDFLTRTFQPLVGKVADNNFLQTSAFVGSLSRTAQADSLGVERLAGRLERVDPKVREEFATLARKISSKSTAQASYQTPVGTRIAKQPERYQDRVTR